MAVVLAVTGAPAAAQSSSIDYTISAQTTASALNEWARQSGRQILFPFDAVAGRSSPGITGRYTRAEALRRLLAGTALATVADDGSTVTLRTRDAAETSATDSGNVGLSEIIVTAQRRPERQQTVPISLTAVDERAIDDARINQLRDLSRITPGLVVSNFSLGSPVVALRGAVNTFNQIGVDKPVGVVVDDVFIPRNSASTFELFGLQSIQVLRGPQGTLFGKNVTGGVLVFDTGRPAFDTQAAKGRLTLGNYRTVELDAIADTALGENAAGRVAFSARRHDGWGQDRLSGQELDDLDSANVRGQVRVRLGERVEALIAGDYAADRSGGRTLSSIGLGSDGDRRTAESGNPQLFDREVGGGSLRLFVDTGLGELNSITALRRSRSTDRYVNVSANFSFLTGTQSQALSDDRDNVSVFSQELRLVSPEWSAGRFVAGAYFASDRSRRELRSTALSRTGALVTNQLFNGRVAGETYAVFADGTLNVAPFLSVTAGGRYTWDIKTADLTLTNALTGAGNFSAVGSRSRWSRFTPRAAVQLTPFRDVMLYATFARGYTAGGYNTQAATLAAFNAAFQPETLDNFEGGLKTEFFDRRLRINLAAFEMKYRDKQELFFNNVTRVLNITNASRATIRGAEAGVSLRPVSWLTLSGTYGRLDTRYDDFVIPAGAVLTGNRLGSAPRDKASALINIDAPVGGVRLLGNVLYSYTSQYFTGATNEAGLQVPGYELVNASIGLASADDRFRLTLFARNLFDIDYLLIPSTQVVRGEYLGEPRRYGVSIQTRF